MQRVAALEAELEEASAALARQQAAARIAERRAADLTQELENNAGAIIRPCSARMLALLLSCQKTCVASSCALPGLQLVDGKSSKEDELPHFVSCTPPCVRWPREPA